MTYRLIFIIETILLSLTSLTVCGQKNATEDSLHFSGRWSSKVDYHSNRPACKDSLTEYAFNCLGNNLKIHIPCNYLRTNYFEYTEGQILKITYADSSEVGVLCGTQADISVSDKKNNGLHCKKVIVKGYQFTYDNVPNQKVQLFEKAFKLLYKDIE
jgi:hypothetical protein